MKKGLVFSIQKFCVHDGPGIRTTVFFKGCPLACPWCHNPESQCYEKEILVNPDLCTLCGRCQAVCPSGAIEIIKGNLTYNQEKCNGCGSCEEHCLRSARQVTGKEYTLESLMQEIEKDRPFYEQSGGGVTFSGGEVMMQIDFVEKLAQRCRDRGISVVIDTCGYVPQKYFERILNYVDLFLYDIKLMNDELHQQFMGKGNKLILDNLKFLSEEGAKINLRIPLIGGVNTDDGHIRGILEMIKDVSIQSINLLPYHDVAKDKYRKLNKGYDEKKFYIPSDERLTEIKDVFQKLNYKVQIGG